jgi:tetratricopeptide (TPR) repeat protein
MKWLAYIILVLLVVGSAAFYQNARTELVRIQGELATLQKTEDIDEEVEVQIADLKSEVKTKEGEQTYKGILLTFLTAGMIGILFVTLVLPIIAHRFTHAVYDSGEMVEKDLLHDAHSLVAQGDYVSAIAAFKEAAAKDPYNRLPWVEIAKIQRTNLEDSDAAIATLREALESQEWQINDAAYLLFRLAELYEQDRHDRTTAAAIMQQVISEFPETRHSANARHKLHEWGVA